MAAERDEAAAERYAEASPGEAAAGADASVYHTKCRAALRLVAEAIEESGGTLQVGCWALGRRAGSAGCDPAVAWV